MDSGKADSPQPRKYRAEEKMPGLEKQLQRLKIEKDANKRNTLALDLADTGDPRVQAAVVELIDRPELADCRATLVYCVGKFDCTDRFLWLIELVCHGNWEVANEAFDILSEIEMVSSEDVNAGFELISSTCNSSQVDHWRAKLVQDLLAMFD